MLRRSKPLAAALVLIATLAACSQPARPGVKVKSLATDLGLGVVLQAAATDEPLDLPPLGDLPIYRGRVTPPPPVSACPEAGLFDFPEKEATPDLTALPPEGTYRWKYDVTIANREEAKKTFAILPPADTARVFGSHTVRATAQDLAEAGGEIIGGDVGAPDQDPVTTAPNPIDRGSINYTVDTFPGLGMGPNTFVRGDRVRAQNSSYADTERTSDDAGEGVSLFTTGWAEGDLSDAKTIKSWLLVHAPPLTLLPLPATPGLDVKSVSTGHGINPAIIAGSPSGLENGPQMSFVIDGKVLGRRAFDACGEMIDAWFVNGTMTMVRDGTATTFDYDYGIATQLGGLVVYERYAYPAEKPVIVVESSIGQAKPTPLED